MDVFGLPLLPVVGDTIDLSFSEAGLIEVSRLVAIAGALPTEGQAIGATVGFIIWVIPEGLAAAMTYLRPSVPRVVHIHGWPLFR